MTPDRRRFIYGAVSTAVILGVAGAAFAVTPAKAPAVKQVVTGPVARYWIDSATNSGMTLGGMGGKPTMSSMFNMMKGGDNTTHSLMLRLGSTQATQGSDALGNHTPSAALGTGPLPLTYSKPSKPVPVQEDGQPSEKPQEPPKGKILIYWGCGEHAGPNQPLVIDLSKLTDPAQRMAMFKQLAPTISLQSAIPPLPSNYASYGEWPNYKSKPVTIGGDASLTGAHAVKTNFAPDINFTLDQSQDFLPPITVTGNQKSANGAVPLTWNAVTGAKALAASVVGGGQDQTVVMWTSAMSNTGWMGILPQYLTPGDIEKLVGNKTLLPGTATTCTVPAEVGNAVQGALYTVVAYGGETNLSYPPRPSDPKLAWNIQWETKIRYRSSTGGLLGQSMGGMMGQGDQSQDKDNGGKKKKSSMFGNMVKSGLGSLIP